MAANQDATLKRYVCEILDACKLDKLIVDREVHLNLDDETDDYGDLVSQKEVDVVAKFRHLGKNILLFFECENSTNSSGVKAHYEGYAAQVKKILSARLALKVVNSTDKALEGKHFRDIDEIHVCFVYGKEFPHAKYESHKKEGDKHEFVVWNFMAFEYYRRISKILGGWTKYELFKDFSLALDLKATVDIPALRLKQKDHTMYLASIHPGLLLKIGYVVRRASEKTYAYQRMLNGNRIKAIGEFISQAGSSNFIPNAVIAVFDSDNETQDAISYHPKTQKLKIPLKYCCAWIIDGQHRAFGFLGTQYEDWAPDKSEPFELPIVLFQSLDQIVQTETFININYNQKRIKSDLLCDLVTLTKNLQHRLTWASLLGHELNNRQKSPLQDKVRISELHSGRPISLASLIQYGLLEGLLGYKAKGGYAGPLYKLAPFNRAEGFATAQNQNAFKVQADLLIRFLVAVQKNTNTKDAATDPWSNTAEFALLLATGLNASFLLLARILERHSGAALDMNKYLKPLQHVNFRRDRVAKMGGGWKGFRELANSMIKKINRGKAKSKQLRLYGEKEKM